MNTWVLSVLSAEIEVSANSRIHRYWPYLTGHVERSQTSLLTRYLHYHSQKSYLTNGLMAEKA